MLEKNDVENFQFELSVSSATPVTMNEVEKAQCSICPKQFSTSEKGCCPMSLLCPTCRQALEDIAVGDESCDDDCVENPEHGKIINLQLFIN